MRLSPSVAHSEAPQTPSHRDGSWRWAVIHFPCLEPVTPRGEIVMVSDRKHVPEARRKFPDLVFWHVREVALFGKHMDSAGLDEKAFVVVNRLKLRMHGWFAGVERERSCVSGVVSGGSE